MKPKHATLFTIESDKRLSHSCLWDMQRNFFLQSGVEAWRQNTVPHYITSNTFIANSFAKVVCGFLKDCNTRFSSSEQDSIAHLDHNQPVYIIELGSGAGRFAFHFLKKFLKLFNNSVMKNIQVKYVMTDIAEGNIDFWCNHPRLQTFVEQGLLDFAHFDIGHDRELKLKHSGESLSPDTIKNPIIVLANYVFDSIPQDVFYVKDGQLYESLVSILSSKIEMDLKAPDLLNHIRISYRHQTIKNDYYEDPGCNKILHDYQHQLLDTMLLFPCAAISCIRELKHLSGGRMLLLTADKGYCRKQDLVGKGEPDINLHGSFSMMVNYDALSQYVLNQGGRVLQTTHSHPNLQVLAFIFGRSPSSIVETHEAYSAAVEQFSPHDFFVIKRGIDNMHGIMNLPQILAYLRLSGWDAKVFLSCFPTLLDLSDSFSEIERQELYQAIQQVWDNYYPINEECDLAFFIGMLLYGMMFYTEALDYFWYSLNLSGLNASTIYNMGMCYYNLRQWRAALKCLSQTLVLDPAFKPAAEMRVKILSEIEVVATDHSLRVASA